MTIVGCDFHPEWQQVAVFDSSTGEIRELKAVAGGFGSMRQHEHRWMVERCSIAGDNSVMLGALGPHLNSAHTR
jgi:hypothetical protein